MSETTVPRNPSVPNWIHVVDNCCTNKPAIDAIGAHVPLQAPGAGVGATVGEGVGGAGVGDSDVVGGVVVSVVVAAVVVAAVVTGQVIEFPRPSVSKPLTWHVASLPEQQSGCAVSKPVKNGRFAAQNAAETLAIHCLSSWQQPSVHVFTEEPSRFVQYAAKPALQHAVFEAKMLIPTAAQLAAGTPFMHCEAGIL